MKSKAGSEGVVGFALLVVGAVAITIATFLPFTESTGTFSTVHSNTMIQHGGWWFILLAIAIAATGYHVCFHKPGNYVTPIINCVIAALYTAYVASSTDSRTLYPVKPDGSPDMSQPGEVAGFGIAIYGVGFGVAIASLGSAVLAFSAHRAIHHPESVARASNDSATKKCPDCAETILTDAKVCRFCGHTFKVKVRCFKCDHSQVVLDHTTTFSCEQCGQMLRRKK